jgi:hypothetical protein
VWAASSITRAVAPRGGAARESRVERNRFSRAARVR